MAKKYNKPQEVQLFATPESELPIDRPVAVYYRQSTDGQIGNVSTAMQTVDMVEYLKRRGYDQDKVLLIDMDGGQSGAKKIDERPGMRHLFDLITDKQIGAVACQDEDRLFRDVTQIQVNIFIEACRSNDVMVLTPSMVYHFSNPMLYAFHARQFRFKCEMAAEYLNTVIRGKLAGAKRRMMYCGQWTGGTVPAGYIVDNRKTLSNGAPNPNWRKYVPFEPFAEIVREYFRLFLQFNGNLRYTARYIQEHGPYYPVPYTLPEGFTTSYRLNEYGKGFCPGVAGLNDMFTNSVYIGHWTVYAVVVNATNHESIVDTVTFMKAFNYLSKLGLDGEPNPYYRGIGMSRSINESERPDSPPLCCGLAYSVDNEGEWRTVGKEWSQHNHYRYIFRSNDQYSTALWERSAKHVDALIVDLLRKKLDATFDSSVWEQALDKSQSQFHKERCRILKQIEALERSMRNQVISLDTISDPDMIRAVQQRYADAKTERTRLESQVSALDSEQSRIAGIQELQKNWAVVLTAWESLDYDQKRSVLVAFVERINIIPLEEAGTEITVYWRDNSHDVVRERRFASKGKTWTRAEDNQLLKLFDAGAGQLEIAKEFPDRRWDKIYLRIYKFRGVAARRFTYQPMRSVETYEQYIQHRGNAPLPLRSTGVSWTKDDDKKLRELVANKADRIEIASHYQHRTWRSIQERIRKLVGKDILVRGKRTVHPNETYAEYMARKNPTVNTINALTNSNMVDSDGHPSPFPHVRRG